MQGLREDKKQKKKKQRRNIQDGKCRENNTGKEEEGERIKGKQCFKSTLISVVERTCSCFPPSAFELDLVVVTVVMLSSATCLLESFFGRLTFSV